MQLCLQDGPDQDQRTIPIGSAENSNRAEGYIDITVLTRFFPMSDTPRRVFVDVGAAGPDRLSMSAAIDFFDDPRRAVALLVLVEHPTNVTHQTVIA